MTHSTISSPHRFTIRASARWIFTVPLFFFATSNYLPCQTAPAANTQDYRTQLSAARIAYFKGVEDDKTAEKAARQQFAALQRGYPQDYLVIAYNGSLDLLESAHTWALWSKHSLAEDGLIKLDDAVNHAPDNLEVRFVRAATTYHLPFFFHRREQAEQDFAFIAPRAEQAAAKGSLSPAIAAAALGYYGQVLRDRGDRDAARQAYEAAVRVDRDSPAGKDAKKRLKQ